MSSTSCLRRSLSPTPLLHLRPPSSRDHRRFTPHTAPPSCACESWSKAWPPMIFCVLIVDSPPDSCQGSVAIQPLKHSREQPTSSSGSPIFLLLHPNGRALRCPLTYIHTVAYIHTYSREVMSNSSYPMDCIPPGSSVHRILQARILEWVAISFSRGSSPPSDQTRVTCIAGRFFTS